MDLQSEVKKELDGSVNGVVRGWVDSVRDGALFQLIFSEMVNDVSRSVWSTAIKDFVKGTFGINLGLPGITLRVSNWHRHGIGVWRGAGARARIEMGPGIEVGLGSGE